jgi:hypothetical protein
MRGGAAAGEAGDDDVDEEDRGGERRRSGRASRMPSGGLRRRGRGLGFAGRTEDRMSGRRTGCGGSGEPDPAEKRSSSSSSKAVEADWSPAAAGARKEPRKRSELGELLRRARSMVELSVCRRVCRCEGGRDVTSLVGGGETAARAQVIGE